jgi:hypothetical protein
MCKGFASFSSSLSLFSSSSLLLLLFPASSIFLHSLRASCIFVFRLPDVSASKASTLLLYLTPLFVSGRNV